MSHEVFRYQDGELHCEGCDLSTIARSVATPFYIYSSGCLLERYRRLDDALSAIPHLICYALKANTQPELLRYLVKEGAGAEVVSGAELGLALRVGFAAEKMVFSGVGKTEAELEAGLRAGILLFLVESEGELVALNELATKLKRRAGVAIRVNPDVDPKTHPHIATGIQTAKFGLDPKTALGLYRRWREFPSLRFTAIHAHIGSQITTSEPLGQNARALVELVDELRADGLRITEVDCGGGLGIRYGDEDHNPPTFDDYARQVIPWVSRSGARLILEPGRSLIGPAGALVVRVLYVKQVHGHRFAVVDSGMHDLLRPSLYDAYHEIIPLAANDGEGEPLDIVGAACESSDVFGRNRRLGDVRPGDLLALLDTGAYGSCMSSCYNLRPRAAEVVVEGPRYRVARRRETVAELVSRELGGWQKEDDDGQDGEDS